MYQDDEQQSRSNINQFALILVVLVMLACVAGWYFFVRQAPTAEPEPLPPVVVQEPTLPEKPLPTEPVPEPEPEPEPVPELPAEPEPEPIPQPDPLPALDNSDVFAMEQVTTVADGMQIGNAINEDSLLRRITVFVDNLAGGEVLRQQGPFTSMTEDFKALEVNNSLYLDPEGYRRYDQYAEFLYRLEEEVLRDAYLRTEPLLDEAYQELGYGPGRFRGTLLDAIEVLLRAPEYEQPLALESHSVNYQFADPDVENRSDAQKMMIRMGPDNARKVKSLLRRFKAALNE
ncbi:DUF3014 domain-containing protein [Ferrimonas marina]|uniref:DUF3014 domain-containing protein n=1 Tax=Ferrimonas marina TaxID=299255 RepID=A0A1M5ZBD2_9GAMM|nr:DUF3014 domain-containing protein [Ferrimonas marina]SHI21213.1 Protein of unknown function [Ferrimonas marina]